MSDTTTPFSSPPSPTSLPPTPPTPPTPPVPPVPSIPSLPSTSRLRPLLPLLLLLPLLIATFITSFFFFSQQRQPKTSSLARQSPGDGGRASNPTPHPSLPISPISPIPTKSSGFSGLLEKDSAQISPTSPPQGEISTPPTASSVSSPNKADPASERAIFDIRAENDRFSPNQLTAYTGQVIVIYFTAVDKTYDVVFPDLSLKKIIKQGQKTPLEFQATSFGQFIFLCQDNCPEGTTAKGLLTITPGV